MQKEALLGIVSDPFGHEETEVRAPSAGIVIGRTSLPLVTEGEALFHIARFQDIHEVAEQLEAFQLEYDMEYEGDPPII